MQGAGDRPEGTFVAIAGDEVVGYAKLSFWDAKPDTPFHDLTGVKRAWRGRGIARALKHAQLNWAREQGYRALRTAMVDRNEPIRRLNAELGYEPIQGRIYVGRPIAG
jgi:mycothiol synthase